ncbi:MAG: VWA domain-containing protein, partial [Anaerolineales bacterium]
LQRSSYRLIWLNPLLGSPDYEPLTRGMQTALPFVDDFLPVHNLASLEDLAAHLVGLEGGRPARKQVSVRDRVKVSFIVSDPNSGLQL